MEGITILATKAVNCEPHVLVTLGVVFSIAFAFGMFLAALKSLEERDDLFTGIYILIACVFVIGAFHCIKETNEQISVFSHYEYKVLIDDSVPLNEFNEKYEILDQEGQIYTVIEREVDE